MKRSVNTHPSSVSEAKAALLAMTAEAAELQNAVGGPITDSVAGWLGPHYALAAPKRLATAKADERLEILRTFVQDWALLRRGDHYAMRLAIERERLEHEKAASTERKEAEFWEWTRKPEIRDKLIPRRTRESQMRRVRQIINHFIMGTPLPRQRTSRKRQLLQPPMT